MNLKDKSGNFRTLSLFLETNQTDMQAVFTLKDYDHELRGVEYPSLKLIYLSYDDPTEWEFAQDVFGNWRHWEKICGNARLRQWINQWREEQEVKIRSQAIREMLKHSKNRDSAAKWVAEKGWDKSLGRPTKKQLEQEEKVSEKIDFTLREHWERMNGS